MQGKSNRWSVSDEVSSFQLRIWRKDLLTLYDSLDGDIDLYFQNLGIVVTVVVIVVLAFRIAFAFLLLVLGESGEEFAELLGRWRNIGVLRHGCSSEYGGRTESVRGLCKTSDRGHTTVS